MAYGSVSLDLRQLYSLCKSKESWGRVGRKMGDSMQHALYPMGEFFSYLEVRRDSGKAVATGLRRLAPVKSLVQVQLDVSEDLACH